MEANFMKKNFGIEKLKYIEPSYDYQELLANLTKKELTEIRKRWNFHGISQLNKAELIEELIKRITAKLESWIMLLGSDQIEFLKSIAASCESYPGAYFELNQMVYRIAKYFQARGVLFFGRHQDVPLFLMPNKLRRKIKMIVNKKRVKKQLKLNNDYLKYAVGSAVYYGVLTPELLYKSLARYMKLGDKIDPLDVVLEYSHYSMLFYSSESFFVLSTVEDPWEILIERKNRSELDYYIPSKKAVENAYQKGHPTWSLAQRRFKKRLTKNYQLPAQIAEKLIFNFSLLMKNNIGTEEIIRILAESFEIDVFEAEDDLLQLINDFRNNTRQWILKGHTSAEVYGQYR